MNLPPLLSTLDIARLPPDGLSAFIAQTHAQPDLAQAAMQMFHVLLALGHRDFALDMQAAALKQRQVYRLRSAKPPRIRLLAFMAPGDMLDNTPLEFVVDGSDIQLDWVYVLPHQTLPSELPEHDVAMVAIGESDRNKPLLDALALRLLDWPKPVINPARHVLNCARDTASALLQGIPGLLMPLTHRLHRQALAQLELPCLVRPIDTQAGQGLHKIDVPSDWDAYLLAQTGDWHHACAYVDYPSPDGLFRKWRIALIDGQPCACHLALSTHWMVHYQSAGMHLSEAKRAEEAQQMHAFDTDFAVRHGPALREVAHRMGLDHLILDCAETRDGRLLVFEADSRAWIHATDPVELFAYKPALMQKAFEAFRGMLLGRLHKASLKTEQA